MQNASFYDRGNELFEVKRQKHTRDDGEVEVVNLEKTIQLQRRPIAHDLATAKDDDVVGDEHGGRLLVCRHWRFARHEAEVLRPVALDGDKGAFEDRP